MTGDAASLALQFADVARERAAVRAKPFMDCRSNELPLGWLDDRQFELLALSLAESSIRDGKLDFDTAKVLPVGADEGRDVILLRRQQIVGVIQCKHYKSRLDLPRVLIELLRFAPRVVRKTDLAPQPKGFLYELWTSEEIAGTAQRFFNSPRDYAASHRLELLALANKAREGMTGLLSPDDKTAAGENEAAVDLITLFDLRWIGPTNIRLRLASDDDVRRRFFRGPEDAFVRMGSSDVERLMSSLRADRARRALRNANYVRRQVLEDEFESFLRSSKRALAVVGGTGQGKSTWTGHLVEQSPPSLIVDVILGEDIRPDDRNAADTLARVLRSRPIGALSSVDIVQAVWDWFELCEPPGSCRWSRQSG